MPTSPLRRAASAAAVVAAGAVAFSSGPAAAQTCYPPTAGCVTTTSSATTVQPSLQLSKNVVNRGETITATATGFQPGTTGIDTIASVEQQIGTFTVSPAGVGTARITIPGNISLGAHTIFARGTSVNGGPAAPSQGITVVAGTTGTTGGTTLARTGAVVVPTALVGAGLVAGGMALKRSSRRGKATKPA